MPGDISKKEEIQKLVKEVESQEQNGIHLLVNNAGIARDDNTKYSNGKPNFKVILIRRFWSITDNIQSAQSISDHLMKSDPQAWADTFSTNVSSQFFVAAGFLPLLAKSRDNTPGFSPSIVNITSISGKYKPCLLSIDIC